MEATYKLDASELNDDFVKAVKKVFKNKRIRITISTDTLSNNEGREEFLKAVEDVRLRKNLVSFSVEEFKDFSAALLKK